MLRLCGLNLRSPSKLWVGEVGGLTGDNKGVLAERQKEGP